MCIHVGVHACMHTPGILTLRKNSCVNISEEVLGPCFPERCALFSGLASACGISELIRS